MCHTSAGRARALLAGGGEDGDLGRRSHAMNVEAVASGVAAARRPLAAVGAEPRVWWNPRRPWNPR